MIITMIKVIATVHQFIWCMLIECRVAANPQTKPTDFSCESTIIKAATILDSGLIDNIAAATGVTTDWKWSPKDGLHAYKANVHHTENCIMTQYFVNW